MRLYNEISNKLVIDSDEPICNRAKLDTGTHCNYKCSFCYYKTKLNEVTEFEIIKKRVDYLVSCGITEVDLSGGESSIHKNWFDILDYCSSLGLRISTLSNGYKFADIEFLRKSKDHGLREILFSVHGYDKDSHNNLVGNRLGFDRITQAIHNAHNLGIVVRINCTVTRDNCDNLSSDFVELMRELRPFEVNFLTLNYWDDANSQKPIDYGYITPCIHGAIDQLEDFVDIINVRYTPYCFMVGYEKYVCNYYQHIYDIYDWNIAVYDGKIDPNEYKKDPVKHLFESAKNQRNRTYYKTKECMDCKFFYLCDGIEKKINNVELKPIPGEKITAVNFYRSGFYR